MPSTVRLFTRQLADHHQASVRYGISVPVTLAMSVGQLFAQSPGGSFVVGRSLVPAVGIGAVRFADYPARMPQHTRNCQQNASAGMVADATI